MTAYLRPGDVIHVAVPIGVNILPSKIDEYLRGELDNYAHSYAQFGVQVVKLSGSSTLTTPVVVAVFRTVTGDGERPCDRSWPVIELSRE